MNHNRAAGFIILAFMLLISQGCSGYPGQKTGFAYILEQGGHLSMAAGDKNPAVSGPEKPDPAIRPAAAPEKTKKVYLTFDDGPHVINTPLILDILDRYRVKATFFVVGTNVDKHPEILRDIVKRGHAVGNHTYNHRYSDIYSGKAAFLQSLKSNEDLIYRIAGLRPQFVRDPGGEMRKSKALKDFLAQNGYRLVDWNVDSYDSRVPPPEGPDIVENIRLQSVKAHLWPGMIVLMHDGTGHINTVRALPTVIEMLKSQGFSFEVLE